MSKTHVYTVIRSDNDRHRKNKYTSHLKPRNSLHEEQDVLRPLGMRLSSPESVHNHIFYPPYKALCLRPLFLRQSRASLPNIIPNRFKQCTFCCDFVQYATFRACVQAFLLVWNRLIATPCTMAPTLIIFLYCCKLKSSRLVWISSAFLH